MRLLTVFLSVMSAYFVLAFAFDNEVMVVLFQESLFDDDLDQMAASVVRWQVLGAVLLLIGGGMSWSTPRIAIVAFLLAFAALALAQREIPSGSPFVYLMWSGLVLAISSFAASKEKAIDDAKKYRQEQRDIERNELLMALRDQLGFEDDEDNVIEEYEALADEEGGPAPAQS